MPFGDHLCTYQKVDLAAPELVQDVLELALPASHVAVQARHAGAGKELGELLLHLFRSLAHVIKMLAIAIRATSGHRRGITAVMTN